MGLDAVVYRGKVEKYKLKARNQVLNAKRPE